MDRLIHTRWAEMGISDITENIDAYVGALCGLATILYHALHIEILSCEVQSAQLVDAHAKIFSWQTACIRL